MQVDAAQLCCGDIKTLIVITLLLNWFNWGFLVLKIGVFQLMLIDNYVCVCVGYSADYVL